MKQNKELKNRLKYGKLIDDDDVVWGVIHNKAGKLEDVFFVDSSITFKFPRKVYNLNSQSTRDMYTVKQIKELKAIFERVKDDK